VPLNDEEGKPAGHLHLGLLLIKEAPPGQDVGERGGGGPRCAACATSLDTVNRLLLPLMPIRQLGDVSWAACPAAPQAPPPGVCWGRCPAAGRPRPHLPPSPTPSSSRLLGRPRCRCVKWQCLQVCTPWCPTHRTSIGRGGLSAHAGAGDPGSWKHAGPKQAWLWLAGEVRRTAPKAQSHGTARRREGR
jgi:hypothetical protein